MSFPHPQDGFSLQAINGLSITYQQKLELVVCCGECFIVPLPQTGARKSLTNFVGK